MTFKHVEDLEEWLEPMGYDEFWEAMNAYGLQPQSKEHCDGQLARQEVEGKLMLHCLKDMAQENLSSIMRLKRRPAEMPNNRTAWLH